MIIVTILIITSSIIHIISEYKKKYGIIYTSKPLTVLLIMSFFLLRNPEFELFDYLLLAGFICSLVGDIFLMLQHKKFLEGLFAFLIAHIFFIAAFTNLISTITFHYYLIPLLLLNMAVFMYLRKGLKRYTIPVILYMLVLSTMVYMAILVRMEIHSVASTWILTGAVSFMYSDAMLAIDKFERPFKAAKALILSTYYFALYSFASGALLL
ncbi:MAG: lysoplasmalogenase [Calditrichia bacterium]